MSSVMYPETNGTATHMKCIDWWRLTGKSWERCIENNPYKSHNDDAVIIAKGNKFEGDEAE